MKRAGKKVQTARRGREVVDFSFSRKGAVNQR